MQETEKYCQAVVDELNSEVDFNFLVNGKSVCDRYERMHRDFEVEDRKDALQCGVGGNIMEEQYLWSSMRDAHEELFIQHK